MIQWESKLQEWCEKIGASHAGLATLSKPLTWAYYEDWIEKGYAADMNYLSEHAKVKENPQLWKPDLRSAVVIAFPYAPHPFGPSPLPASRTALYSQGIDYHFWIKSQLQIVIDELRALFPSEIFEQHTDSSPLLERDLAQRAGLGWFGKNTCLIHPKKGSLFLLGEILTSLEFSAGSHGTSDFLAAPIPDFCGTCQRCMVACPTEAIESPHVLDAAKCISYLTIESRKIPSPELRPKMGDWLFGCDICQTVCPWNEKVFRSRARDSALVDDLANVENLAQSENSAHSAHSAHSTNVAPSANAANVDLKKSRRAIPQAPLFETTPLANLPPAAADALAEELRYLISASHNQILKKIKGTPMARAGAKGLKRNALIVIANRKLHELIPEVSALIDDDYVGELAGWTLTQLEAD